MSIAVAIGALAWAGILAACDFDAIDALGATVAVVMIARLFQHIEDQGSI